MKVLTSSLSSKGQTTLPVEIRKKLNIKQGDLIQYEVSEDGTYIRLFKVKSVDLTWAKAIENTLTEWKGSEDDDL